ncbi:hypothetical protein [Streptomyces griseus]|uniref:hypothetical protein n=1 Tax=Streptomyces griseus TaxID=1911 RepID=UPI00362E9529
MHLAGLTEADTGLDAVPRRLRAVPKTEETAMRDTREAREAPDAAARQVRR